MGIGCDAEQGVVVAVGAIGQCHLHQGTVIRCIGRMGDVPRTRMTGGAFTAASRDRGLQVRNGRMTEAAITKMGDSDRCISGGTRIVTG